MNKDQKDHAVHSLIPPALSQALPSTQMEPAIANFRRHQNEQADDEEITNPIILVEDLTTDREPSPELLAAMKSASETIRTPEPDPDKPHPKTMRGSHLPDPPSPR